MEEPIPCAHQPGYYAILPANVRYSKVLPPAARLLYAEITSLTHKEGYCWATNDYFAKLYEVSISTVSRWISKLVQAGFISEELNKENGNSRRLYVAPAPNAIGVAPETPIPIRKNAYTYTQKAQDMNNKTNTKPKKLLPTYVGNNASYDTPVPDTPKSLEYHALPGLSEGQRLFLGKFRRKRFATDDQRAAIAELESTYGLAALVEALTWAAENGITMISSIRTRTKNIAKNGGGNGGTSEHSGSSPPGKYDNLPEIVAYH